MKIIGVMTVVVVFATADSAAQRRNGSDIIGCHKKIKMYRGSVTLLKDGKTVGDLALEQRGPEGVVSISGSLYGLPAAKYIGIVYDGSTYNDTCNLGAPAVSKKDMDTGITSIWAVFPPIATKGENNTLKTTSYSITLNPDSITYIIDYMVLIYPVPLSEDPSVWNMLPENATFPPAVACGFLHAAAWILALSLVSGCRATSVEAPGVIARSGAEAVLDEATEDYWAGSGSGPEDEESLRNETREALTHEASDQDAVVYVGEGATYVPVPSLKSRPLSPNLQALQTLQGLQGLAGGGTGGGGGGVGGGGTGSAGGTDEEWGRHPETWDREHRRYRPNTTRVQHIEAECQDDYMKIRIGFNGSFAGLLYSAGYSYDPDCMYVNGTGRDYYEFYIQLNRCGTLGENTHHQDSRKNPTKNLMWNTVTVQYNPMIEEEFDEHFKVTCEYGYDFWKTVTFPFLDVEVATGNPVVFTLQPPECYMEIRYGYGTTGTRVAGPVRVGDPLTLIIYMRSKYDGFDIVVNDCYAHNGGNKRIQLIDQYGCPVDDKLISRFRGSWSESGLFETQVFAYMKTFRFTGSPALYIECDVRMCHGRCPSQPCHWRNSKNVAKRSVTSAIGGPTTPATSLSENVNLFQSLRVLQEGEAEAELFPNSTAAPQNGAAESPSGDRVCLKSSLVSTIVGLGCGIVCIMAGALLAVCSRMRRAAREKLLSDSIDYMTHKGRIN